MACARDGGLSFQGPAAGLDPPARAEDGQAATRTVQGTRRLEPARHPPQQLPGKHWHASASGPVTAGGTANMMCLGLLAAGDSELETFKLTRKFESAKA
jgi:hypothetical protein